MQAPAKTRRLKEVRLSPSCNLKSYPGLSLPRTSICKVKVIFSKQYTVNKSLLQLYSQLRVTRTWSRVTADVEVPWPRMNFQAGTPSNAWGCSKSFASYKNICCSEKYPRVSQTSRRFLRSNLTQFQAFSAVPNTFLSLQHLDRGSNLFCQDEVLNNPHRCPLFPCSRFCSSFK